MDTVTIYGASDDLIEVEGAISEEFSAAGSEPSYLSFSDGTVLRVSYDGLWHITAVERGASTGIRHTPAEDEDADRREDGSSGYSDRVILSGDNLRSVVFGSEYAKGK
jgi:hypothetical protein